MQLGKRGSYFPWGIGQIFSPTGTGMADKALELE